MQPAQLYVKPVGNMYAIGVDVIDALGRPMYFLPLCIFPTIGEIDVAANNLITLLNAIVNSYAPRKQPLNIDVWKKAFGEQL